MLEYGACVENKETDHKIPVDGLQMGEGFADIVNACDVLKTHSLKQNNVDISTNRVYPPKVTHTPTIRINVRSESC